MAFFLQSIRAWRIMGYVVILTSLIPLAFALYVYQSTSTLLEHGLRTEGTVVEIIEAGRGSNGQTMYSSVFVFNDSAGQEHRVTERMSASRRRHEVGQRLQIIYDPASPLSAQINSTFDLWFGAYLGFGICLGSILLGLAFIFLPPMFQK